MKKTVKLLAGCLCACALGACGESASYKFLDRPENTNLELWITQKLEAEDIKDMTELGGCFGCRLFLGSKYTPAYYDGNSFAPSTPNGPYVEYEASGYPDSSDSYHITGITIKDPEVTVYGLTMNSTKEEISRTMKDEGFHEHCEGEYCKWSKHNCVFNFYNNSDNEIYIGASSTNLHHRIY